jgi:hypothetical protein
MNANRLIKSLPILSLLTALALPLAAHATPFVDPYAAPIRTHLSSPSRAAYYAVKEVQLQRLDNASFRRQHAARPILRRTAGSYAAMKDKQMERILNGE